MKKIMMILAIVFLSGCAGPYEFVRTDCNTDAYQCLAVWAREHPEAELAVRIGTTGIFNAGHVQAVADGAPLSVGKEGLQGVETGHDEFYGGEFRTYPKEPFERAYKTGLPMSEALVKEFSNDLVSKSCGPVTAHYDPDVWKVSFRKEN